MLWLTAVFKFGGVVKKFFQTDLGKLILKILILLLIIAGIFWYGHHRGYDSGYTKGVDSQKPAIAKLVKQLNDEHKAIDAKIKRIEDKAKRDIAFAQSQQKIKIEVRQKIVDHYHKTFVEVASKSSLSEPSVKAINDLLDTQVTFGIPKETPK